MEKMQNSPFEESRRLRTALGSPDSLSKLRKGVAAKLKLFMKYWLALISQHSDQSQSRGVLHPETFCQEKYDLGVYFAIFRLWACEWPNGVDVEFDNGNAYNSLAEYLRVYSPAVSKIRSTGGEKGLNELGYIWEVTLELCPQPVGNYGVRLLFDDLHETRIFTREYFYHLGSNKSTLMREHIRTLKKHGLSRDPTPWMK